MLKSKNFKFWFVIIVIQIIIACAVPTGIFLLLPAENETINLDISDRFFKNLTPEEAENVLKTYFADIIDSGAVVLNADGKSAEIPYKLFELQIDASKIFEAIHKGRFSNRYFQLIGKSNQDDVPKPIISLNSAKLKDALKRYMALFIKEPVDASLVLQQGTVKITPGIDGVALDINEAVAYIKKQLEFEPIKEIVISQSSTPEVFTVLKPEYTGEELSRFTQIYGLVKGELPSDSINPFQNILDNINELKIAPGEEFSYRERAPLTLETDSSHIVLASAIYKAVLSVPDIKVTYRKPANQPIPDIEPGFEVNLEKDGDLKFLNASDSNLLLVYNVEKTGKWEIALVGEPGLTFGEIKTEHIKIAPPVIYSQDIKLPVNSQEVIEPGKEGLTVRVFRVIENEVTQLYEDVYQPVYKIIAIGSEVKKGDINRK